MVYFVIAIFLANVFTVNAQSPFYDTKKEDGKIISNIKYVMGNRGLYEQKSVSKYTYDKNGDFEKKEVYVWIPKYAQDQRGNYYPDYSEKNYVPHYCIAHRKDPGIGTVSFTLHLWDRKKNSYGAAAEKMIFLQDEANGLLNYLAFQKKNEYLVQIDNINYDIHYAWQMLAGSVK
jgi:hypothetical protein